MVSVAEPLRADRIGTEEYVTVAELVQTVIDVSGKRIGIEYVERPVGVHARNLKQPAVAQGPYCTPWGVRRLEPGVGTEAPDCSLQEVGCASAGLMGCEEG